MIITPLLVIFMIIVFVLLYLFMNTIDKRKWLTILISIALTPVVYFYLFYPFINILSNYHHQKYFNAEAWIEKPRLRYEMIDHVIASDTLIGMDKPSIEHLLGKYEWLSWDDAKKTHSNDHWNYGLGIEPGALNTQKDCVEIIFKNNTVIQLKTYKEELTFDAKTED